MWIRKSNEEIARLLAKKRVPWWKAGLWALGTASVFHGTADWWVFLLLLEAYFIFYAAGYYYCGHVPGIPDLDLYFGHTRAAACICPRCGEGLSSLKCSVCGIKTESAEYYDWREEPVEAGQPRESSEPTARGGAGETRG